VKSDHPYLAHIADAIAAIETYVAGGREAFMRERLIQDAVVRNFEIIGEAASRLSPALRDASDVPWPESWRSATDLSTATGASIRSSWVRD
jgi:uncharacterized protein with HEPN domain